MQYAKIEPSSKPYGGSGRYTQGWHLSFTQVFPRVKHCLGKTGKNWVKPLCFPLNRTVLPLDETGFLIR